MTGAPTRRQALILGGAAAVGGCLPAPPARAANPQPWLAYEARLRTALANAGAPREDTAATLLDLVNRFRTERALRPLRGHTALALAAHAHVADMASRTFFDHDSPEGYGPDDRVGLLARRFCGLSGENLAFHRSARAPSAQAILQGWIDSPGHLKNLQRADYNCVGHAVLRVGARTYAAQVFGGEYARLAADLPLRADPRQVGQAIGAADPPMSQFGVSLPGQAQPDGPWPVRAPPKLPAGVWRLRPLLAHGRGSYDILWGPIFVV